MTSAPTSLVAGDPPQGEFAIVEALGHRKLIGRVAEVERFGTKMLQIEPFFGDFMHGPVLLGGGSIYQFTPCSIEVALKARPTSGYQIPASLLATIPALALPPPEDDPF